MGADQQFKQLIDRILRCRQAEDDAKADTKDVYAELKALGFDKTAAGALVAELRKKDRDAAGFEERSAILDLYRDAYERASGTVVATHTHEKFPRPALLGADDGQRSILSSEAGGAKMDGWCSDRPGRLTAPAVEHPANSEQAVTPSAMTAKTKADVMRLLRPFCQHLEDSEKCGGHGSKHCHTCQLLADTARATA